jgi:succinate-semialdehyde dehydrogenase/glutarate-semialdehyde dehydrogenase
MAQGVIGQPNEEFSMSITASLTGSESAVLNGVPNGLFIGGEWRPAARGLMIDVEDPATK